MTEETRLKLLANTEYRIAEITSAIDEVRRFLKNNEKLYSVLAERNINIEIKGINKILDYRLFIGLLILDLASATRFYLHAKYQYEGLFSARQILVIINEGYKKIYNFVKQNEKEDDITKYRNQSFWVKDIGTIINNDLPNLQSEYFILTKELEDYLRFNFNEIKIQRDLSIHYDRNPAKVYDMLLGLDIEETFKKLIPFLDILNKMFDFTHSLAIGYKEKLDIDKNKQKTTLEDIVNKLEGYKNSQNEASISNLQETIRNSINTFWQRESPIT